MRLEIRDSNKKLVAWTYCDLAKDDTYRFASRVLVHPYLYTLRTALNSINRGELSGKLNDLTYNANYEY
jgi:hypothetical protein